MRRPPEVSLVPFDEALLPVAQPHSWVAFDADGRPVGKVGCDVYDREGVDDRRAARGLDGDQPGQVAGNPIRAPSVRAEP